MPSKHFSALKSRTPGEYRSQLIFDIEKISDETKRLSFLFDHCYKKV